MDSRLKPGIVAELAKDYLTQTALWKLLVLTRNTLASEPKDRILALRSLILHDRQELDEILQYDKGIEAMFQEVTVFLAPVIGTLLLLALQYPHSMKMPSWVPDWSQNSHIHLKKALAKSFCYTPFPGIADKFVIRPTFCTDGHYQDSHQVLCLQGIQYSTITDLCASFDFENSRDRYLSCFQDLRIAIRNSNLTEVHEAGQGLHGLRASPALISAILNMSEVSVVDLLFRQLWDHAVIDEHGSTRDWTQDTQDLAESLHGCCIFLDNTGSLGIVPAAAQEGDTVCIVAGTTNYTAVLLQKRTEGDWTIVSGDCGFPSVRSLNNVVAKPDDLQEFVIW